MAPTEMEDQRRLSETANAVLRAHHPYIIRTHLHQKCIQQLALCSLYVTHVAEHDCHPLAIEHNKEEAFERCHEILNGLKHDGVRVVNCK